MEVETITFIQLVLLIQSVILLHSINEAINPEEDVNCRGRGSATNYQLQSNSSGCFCCPAAISDCQHHHRSTARWYRCSGTEKTGSCQFEVPTNPSTSRNEQLSVWVHEVGSKICFTNFTPAAVGKYCCTPPGSSTQCAMISVQLLG